MQGFVHPFTSRHHWGEWLSGFHMNACRAAHLKQLVEVVICAGQESSHDGVLNGLPLLGRHCHYRCLACTL